jgi:hypothetical protein
MFRRQQEYRIAKDSVQVLFSNPTIPDTTMQTSPPDKETEIHSIFWAANSCYNEQNYEQANTLYNIVVAVSGKENEITAQSKEYLAQALVTDMKRQKGFIASCC